MDWTVEYPTDTVSLYVHKDNTVTVSEDEAWLPGVYESREAALAALNVDPDKLYALAQRRTVITAQELA